MSFFVPTRFVWRFGGRQVHLCGSFTRWVETIPMAPVDGTPGVFAVVVHLPPGYHQYKFIVDGKWMHDETAPYMPDPLGNVNNWLFVRKIDPPTPQNGLTLEHQQQLLQQLQEQQAAAAALTQQQTAQLQAAADAQQALQQQQVHQQAAAQLQQPQVQHHLQQQHQQHAALNPMLQQSTFGASRGGHTPSAAGAAAPDMAAAMNDAGALQQGMIGSAAAAALQVAAQQLALTAGVASPADTDVDMVAADNTVVAPIIMQNEREPDLTKKKVSDFLHSHRAYELIPESGKVVLLDMDLPVRQAFHALHEQGIASAPLYDSQFGGVVGVISASDFIHMLRRLKHAVSSGNNPLSEAEMDAHTIRSMREECIQEGRPPKPLVYVRTTDKLATVVRTLFQHKCSMAPILTAHPCDRPGSPLPSVLHIATLSAVLSCLMRHFRASLASLPLLALPLGQLPIGTWAPEQQFLLGGQQQQQQRQITASGSVNGEVQGMSSKGRRSSSGAADGSSDGSRGEGSGVPGRTVSPLHAVTLSTPLTTALGTLLEAGVSALPVVNEQGVLLDIYARADITQLCKGNAYSRLQWEDVTVGQALSLSSPLPTAWQQATTAGSRAALQGPTDLSAAVATNPHLADSQLRGGAPGGSYGAAAAAAGTLAGGRVAVAYQDDPLRVVVERLACPGVRRLLVVDRASRRVQGLVSLSDVAAYLFL